MPMHEPMTLGRWMKRLRAEHDLTQEALAEALGCAVQTIRTFETGTRRPSRALAERLAGVLQIPPEQRADFVRLARTSAGTQGLARERAAGTLPAAGPDRGPVAVALPRGTVTLVFTDIEGSTMLLQALGEGYVDLL